MYSILRKTITVAIYCFVLRASENELKYKSNVKYKRFVVCTIIIEFGGTFKRCTNRGGFERLNIKLQAHGWKGKGRQARSGLYPCPKVMAKIPSIRPPDNEYYVLFYFFTKYIF